MNDGKKAQVEVTFNWIYIVIAGAVILLFFAGIIVKQKIASEEGLDRDVMRIMENIFTAAQVSENTKTVIDMGGLKDYVFYFKCEEGVSKYGLEGRSMPVEDQANPIFAPSQIQSSLLITWSVPYKLPFKVIDFMFITSSNTKYFLWGKSDLSEDFLRAISNVSSSNKIAVNFNILEINDLSEIDPGKNFQIRLIDFGGKLQKGDKLPASVEEKIKYLSPGRVTAISFHGAGASTSLDFFEYNQNEWKKKNKDPLPVISLGGEGDAAFYAAIFSGDDLVYQCNMRKAFQRLSYLNEIYGGTELTTKSEAGGKLKEIISFYDLHPELTITGECLNYLINDPENVQSALQSHQNAANACLTLFTAGKLPPECSELVSTAVKLRETNENLVEKGDCIPLY
jgi:hypothetical protein